jgi:hypothetical protein
MGARVADERFERLDLRCHALLADARLHDVWAFPLPGGGPGRTIDDARRALLGDGRPKMNIVVRGLFAVRWALGRVFGWDDDRHDLASASYVHRLTDDDRVRSTVEPGTKEGAFRLLYSFEHEALAEIRNATVHGFLALSLQPRGEGYLLYMAIYLKPTGRLTSVYMALIDPFRRWLVYPALGRNVRRAWTEAYA